jgi:hypothetical protein
MEIAESSDFIRKLIDDVEMENERLFGGERQVRKVKLSIDCPPKSQLVLANSINS